MASQSSLSLEQWQEAASKEFGPLEVDSAAGDEFRMQVDAIAAGDAVLYELSSPAHTVTRRVSSNAAGITPIGKLSLQLEGDCEVTQDGRTCRLGPGDLAFYVSQRPYVLNFAGKQRSLVVQFPQSFVHMPEEDIERVTATRISDDTGLGRVAVPLFEQLAMNFELLDGPHGGSLVRSALDMLVTVLSAELSHDENKAPTTTLFKLAAAYIEENLGDTELRPQKIADALYVSVRHLHTQFAANNESVSALIRKLRLQAIRRDLADPLYAEETIQHISSRYGLLDASYVSRAFRGEYGETPSRYRERVLRAS